MPLTAARVNSMSKIEHKQSLLTDIKNKTTTTDRY